MKLAATRIALVLAAALGAAFSTPVSASEYARLASQTSPSADEQAREALLSWMLSEEEWSSLPSFDGEPVRIVFRRNFPPRLSAAELDALQQEVDGKPDHPRRREFDQELRRAAGATDREFTVILTGDGRTYRASEHRVAPGNTFGSVSTDQTSAPPGQQDWSLVQKHDGGMILHRYPRELDPDREFGPVPQKFRGTLATWLWSLSGRGITPRHLIDSARLVQGEFDTGAIVVEAQMQSGVTATVRLRQHIGDRWVAEEASFAVPGDEGGADRFVYAVPAFNDIVGGLVMPEYTRYDREGRVTFTDTLVSIQALSASEAEEYLRTPEPGGEDPLHDSLRIVSVYDYTQTGATHTEHDPDTAAAGPVSAYRAEDTGSSAPWRWLGWTALGLLAVVTLVIAWRRKPA